MTITGGSALPKDEIDRMIKEAEAHAAEDAARREEAEARNTAENLAYSMEKQLTDNAEKIPEDVASEVREAIAAVKTALEGTDVEAVKSTTATLSEVSQKIGQAIYAAEAAGASDGAEPQDAPVNDADDDVVDAEVVEDEDDKK